MVISILVIIVLFQDTVLFHILFTLSKIFVIILRTKVKFSASAIYLSCINIIVIMVCLSYKGHDHNYLAKGYQLCKSMDITYGIQKFPVFVSTLYALARK